MKAPKAPDPMQTAAAQSGMNRDTAITQMQLNSGSQVTPWGTTATTQTGSQGFLDSQGKWVETPTFTTTQTLSPGEQVIFDRTQAAEQNLAQIAQEQSGKLGDYLNDPFTYNNQDAENWAFDLASQRILPQQQQQQDALRTQLINSGIRPGTAAWNAEMQRMTNANTDQMNQLALTGRSQSFSEALAQRNQPLNELIGLMSGTQVQNPAAMNAQTPQAGVGGVDYTGLVNQKYQADLQNHRGMMGGLFGLGTALIGLSDRRAKENIKRVGETDEGTPIYRYNYKGDSNTVMGVMAQDVEKTQPHAVINHPSGLKLVDYGQVH